MADKLQNVFQHFTPLVYSSLVLVLNEGALVKEK